MNNLRVSNYNFENQFKKNCNDVYEKACDITKGITNKVKSLFPQKLPGKVYIPDHKRGAFFQKEKTQKRNRFFKVLVGILGVLGISLGIYLNRNCITQPPIQEENNDPSTEEKPPSEEPQATAEEKKYYFVNGHNTGFIGEDKQFNFSQNLKVNGDKVKINRTDLYLQIGNCADSRNKIDRIEIPSSIFENMESGTPFSFTLDNQTINGVLDPICHHYDSQKNAQSTAPNKSYPQHFENIKMPFKQKTQFKYKSDIPAGFPMKSDNPLSIDNQLLLSSFKIKNGQTMTEYNYSHFSDFIDFFKK